MTKLHGDYSTEHGKMEAHVWTAVLILVMGILIGVAMCCIQALCISAQAEETECWVICQPDDYINIREKPGRRGQVSGWATGGMKLTTDGERRGEWLHVTGVTENGDGWIHIGYVVWSEPIRIDREYIICSSGRVAARKTIDGKRRAWLRENDVVNVVWWTKEWCLTDRGFIRSEFVLTGR